MSISSRSRPLPDTASDPAGRIVDELDAIVWEWSPGRSCFTFVSEGAERILGYSRAQWLAEPNFWSLHLHPEDRERALAYTMSELEAGRDHTFEYRMMAADGRVVCMRDHARVRRGADGAVLSLSGVMFDVTERQSGLDALRSSEIWNRTLNEQSLDVITVLSENGTILYESPSVERVLGHKPGELVRLNAFDLIHPDDREAAEAVFREVLDRKLGTGRAQFRFPHKAGGWRVMEAYGRDLTADPVVKGVVINSRDVTERHEAERALRESEARHRTVIGALSEGVVLIDAKGIVQAVNEAAARIYERTPEQLLGTRVGSHTWSVFKEDGTPLQFEERPAIRALREGRVVENFVVGIRSAESGILRWVRLHARPIIFPGEERPSLAVSSLTDITEQRRLESLLAHTQKMEAVGRLAGGVAHDFNNLLTALRGYTDLLLLESPPDSPQHAYAEQIARAGERASALTRQLLTLSRRQILKLEVFDLHDLLRDLNGMLQGLLGANVTLQLRLDATRTHLNMDRGQLEQVVLNLVINSRDAMPRGGSLWIETCDASLTGRESNLVCVGQPGAHVELRVRDSGAGMDRETLQHIFEPFYTTKPQGEGTGLGLASVYGVVQRCAGSLAVSSTPGSGTEFRVYLPLTGDSPGRLPAAPGLRAHRGGSERVLLVEDEPMVRALITSVLTSSGYRVSAAADAEEALQVADAHPGGFDLLLSDIVMPGMNGLELAALLLARWPRAAVLHMTGYADADSAGAEGLHSGPALLQKPFTPKELLARVRDRLDAAPAGR